MGVAKRRQQAMNMGHFEAFIILGLICFPTKNRIIPINQANICRKRYVGARELTMRRLNDIRIRMENKAGNQFLLIIKTN